MQLKREMPTAQAGSAGVWDEKRWVELLARMGGDAGDSFTAITAAYSEPQRRYHTAHHIRHCLVELDGVRNCCVSQDDVECALWLHDIVYDVHGSDNEERSAEFAGTLLTECGCDIEHIQKVQELVLVTDHKNPPEAADGRLVVDIDLAILGQPPAIFDDYQRKIREEYSFVPLEIYIERRLEILKVFLAKPSIYYTTVFTARYEDQARKNLATAIRDLTSEHTRNRKEHEL